ncbi:MAG: ATP-dependent zinc metalloprotease FtsH [Opitutales bacterium]|nr:ATP-dependent zinc metalloprotease FtsH [Opitutales bacterium]
MPSNPRSVRNRPLNGGSNKFPPQMIVLWSAILLGIFALVVFTEDKGPKVADWTIIQIVQAAEDGEVAEGVIQPNPARGGPDWTDISGTLKPGSQLIVKDVSRFRASGRLTDANLQRLQGTGVFKEKSTGDPIISQLISLLPLVLIVVVIYFVFMRQIRSAGKGAMSFGKSRAKMLVRDKDRATFKDVAGCDEAKEEVSEVVDFLRDPRKFQKIGGRIPKGCLLVGPPGTGKTLLARAVAGEAEVPFFSISGSDFVEMFVGVGAARVRDMFEQGRKNAPCIIFIDEIDAVGRQRGAGLGGGNDEREQTLNSILVEMDGFDAHEGVIIMAATNRPDVLDSALLRPGRFDRQILIDLPDLVGREEILRIHSKKIQMSDAVDLTVVARGTPGMSGADLANLLNESALLAARYGKEKVEMADIDEARDKISMGRERRRLMDDADKKITAWHEAGHAIIQAVLDDGSMPLHKVTIIPRGQALGVTVSLPSKDILHQTKGFLLNHICMALGGRIAEELVFKDITSGASSDIKSVTRTARHMVCDWGMSTLGPISYGENQDHIFLGREISRNQNYSEETARRIDAEVQHIVDEQYERARGILTEKRHEMDMLAEALLQHETLEGKHVMEIVKFGEIRSPIVLQPVPVKDAPKDVLPDAEEAAKAMKIDAQKQGEAPATA